MLDGLMRRALGPGLDAAGRSLARAGATPDAVTALAFALGLAGAGMVAADHMGWALALVLASRGLDGLDGAVARATRGSELGGYLDIVGDFAVYGAVPLAFAVRDPAVALAAAVLLFSFYVNGASFLAYAAVAARRGLMDRGGRVSTSRGVKHLYFTAGLAEGTETILVFAAMLVWPAAFAWLAVAFAVLCGLTTLSRIALAARAFRE